VIIEGWRAAPSQCGIHFAQFYVQKTFLIEIWNPTCVCKCGVCMHMDETCV